MVQPGQSGSTCGQRGQCTAGSRAHGFVGRWCKRVGIGSGTAFISRMDAVMVKTLSEPVEIVFPFVSALDAPQPRRYGSNLH